MKKSILTVILLFIHLILHAQVKLGTYTMSYLDKSYEIFAHKVKGNKFTVYIDVCAETKGTEALLAIESDDLELFKQSLIKTQNKYEEWRKVALENNVTNFSKRVDVQFPLVSVGWYPNSTWLFDLNQHLKPLFMVLDDGTYAISFMEKVRSFSDAEETIYWVFANSKEFSDVISLLDYDSIKVQLQQEEKESRESDLFK